LQCWIRELASWMVDQQEGVVLRPRRQGLHHAEDDAQTNAPSNKLRRYAEPSSELALSRPIVIKDLPLEVIVSATASRALNQ